MPNKKNNKTPILNRQLNFSVKQLILFVAVFGLVGGVVILKSFAAAPSTCGGWIYCYKISPKYTSNISVKMITDANGDGLPNHGDTIALPFTTTYTGGVKVGIVCDQNGIYLDGGSSYSAGPDPSAPWPNDYTIVLGEGLGYGYMHNYRGGEADCNAFVWYETGHKYGNAKVLLANHSFHVNP